MSFALANVAGRAALVLDGNYFDLETVSNGVMSSDLMAAVADSDRLDEVAATLSAHPPTGQLAEAELGPPVPRPQKSFAVGLNYLEHSAESKMNVPENPVVFTKFPSCIVGPAASVELRSDRCDYEGELVVVVGCGGKDISHADAWSHIAGLMVGQDISDRPVQFAAEPAHYDLAKSFDTFGPTGPVLVSAKGLENRDDLRLTTAINGEVRQDDTTASMVFDVPTLVAYLSQVTTLVPGDLIFTGTPSGIGAVSGRFLADGDVITTSIEGVGTISNQCVRTADHSIVGRKS